MTTKTTTNRFRKLTDREAALLDEALDLYIRDTARRDTAATEDAVRLQREVQNSGS